LKLFGKTRVLEAQIDEFLDLVTQAGLVFDSALESYLCHGPTEEFDEFLGQEERIEGRGDALRREIESKLYTQTLIPDLRGDVLRLLEDMDNLINLYEGNLYRMSIQTPDIPQQLHEEFRNLSKTVSQCVESVVMACRAFFRDIEGVRDHNNKVIFFETQADKISTKLQRQVFKTTLPLENKRHLIYFVEHIDELANAAEDITDTLAIYAIKRMI